MVLKKESSKKDLREDPKHQITGKLKAKKKKKSQTWWETSDKVYQCEKKTGSRLVKDIELRNTKWESDTILIIRDHDDNGCICVVTVFKYKMLYMKFKMISDNTKEAVSKLWTSNLQTTCSYKLTL